MLAYTYVVDVALADLIAADVVAVIEEYDGGWREALLPRMASVRYGPMSIRTKTGLPLQGDHGIDPHGACTSR